MIEEHPLALERIAGQPFGAGELSHHQTTTTQPFNKPAEHAIRQAGHRRKKSSGVYKNIPDLQHTSHSQSIHKLRHCNLI